MVAYAFTNEADPRLSVDEGLPLLLHKEILQALTQCASEDLFRSVVPTALQQLLALLDPQQEGVALAVVLCTPPIDGKPVRSLSIRQNYATLPLSEEIAQYPMFFGAE